MKSEQEKKWTRFWTWVLVFCPIFAVLASVGIGIVTAVYDWKLVAVTLLAGLALGYVGLRAIWLVRQKSILWVLRFAVCALLVLVALPVGYSLVTAARSLVAEQEQSWRIAGEVAPGFEEVWSEFERNLRVRGEGGAACAAYLDGEKVVDIWGGLRDEAPEAPWEEDTMVLVFSTTKGMAAMCMAVANSRGWLDYDARVASYWPEFAAEGKQDVTVRQLLAHQAGLCCIHNPVIQAEQLRDFDALAARLAREKPAWPPGANHGYHGLSIGFYEGELLRRVDPQHRSLGRFFQEEIAKPLDAEFYIGLPAEVPESRLARLTFFRTGALGLYADRVMWRFIFDMFRANTLAGGILANPKVDKLLIQYEAPECRGLEAPAVNGVGEARAIARAYSAFATGGAELGLRQETLDELMAPPILPSGGDMDLCLRLPTAYSLGFDKPNISLRFGTNGKAFGTPGMGGSFAYADPEIKASFAYTTNRLGYCLVDPREQALRDAFYRSVRRLPKE